MRRLIAVAAACLALAACATPTVYQAAATPGAVGFTETRIEPGRYRVTFQGGSGAPAAQVEDYALLRAAEITLRDGYDWFTISDRSGEILPPRSSSSVSIGTGGGDLGRHGGVGVGVGTTFDLSGGPMLRRSLEIVMGKGAKPPGPDSYDARGVEDEIGPRAGRR
ncbi:MAG TPA: hypothetical protein VG939_11230 [Caulobacteraceae bacterium]|nr:hypothetical protein [Caulobacteraceae bacterium]